MSEVDTEDSGEIQLIEPPCTIHIHGAPEPFRVPNVEGAAYTSLGVSASGSFTDDGGSDTTILVPFTAIGFIEFHLDELARFQEHEEVDLPSATDA